MGYRGYLAGILLASVCAAPAAEAAGIEPSYADVLREPDNPTINLAYALRLVREGHLNAAQATLARILLTHPEADEIRLTYMIVLYRLDDLASAKQQADILSTRKLSGRLASEYERYAGQIVAKAKPTHFSAYLASGLRVDQDATIVSGADGHNPRQADVSFNSMAGVSVEHQFSGGPIDSAFAQLNFASKTQADYSDYNLMTATLEAGLERRFGALVLRGSGIANGSLVGGELFSREAGGRLRATYEVTDQLKLFVEGEATGQVYNDVKIGVDEEMHSGGRWRSGIGGAYQFTDQHQLIVQGHFGHKDAHSDIYAYQSSEVEAKWLSTFTGGQFISVGALYALYDYDGYSDVYAATRKDDYFKVRASYGVPVRTIGDWLGIDTNTAFVNFGDLGIQLSVDYLNQNSNISAFDRENVGADILFTRRFHF